MRTKSILAATAVATLLAAGLVSAPAANAAMSSDQCFAAFTGLDGNGDKQLTGGEVGKYTKGDANSDGRVSSDEFMKACEEGIFEAMTPN